MRDILFRGKTKDNSEWVYGCLQCFKGFSIFDHATKNFIPVKSGTIGQYTGLEDKNGEMIFEGDIVKTRHWPGTIEWDDHYASFIVHCVGRIETRNSLTGHKELEAIGNVHDNPELLETKTSVSLIDGHIDE